MQYALGDVTITMLGALHIASKHISNNCQAPTAAALQIFNIEFTASEWNASSCSVLVAISTIVKCLLEIGF